MNPRGFCKIIIMATVEVTTGTSEMETSTSASAAKVKIVAPCNSDSGASSSRLNEGHQVQLILSSTVN